ncbi:MAG: Maf family protein [Planctomycetia bacterium]|nr:Maf family protein [Planctomycetia bacterium]
MTFYQKPLILASHSPRRKELLSRAGINFDIFPASEDAEMPIPQNFDGPKNFFSPENFVKMQAQRKAESVMRQMPDRDCLILGCDTVAVCEDVILGKPVDRQDAKKILQKLSGKIHYVITGICLKNPHDPNFEKLEAVKTQLFMENLTEEMLEDYLNSGAWKGKAGAFGYQDKNNWLRIISGSESNVVGLPMERLLEWLADFSFPRTPFF